MIKSVMSVIIILFIFSLFPSAASGKQTDPLDPDYYDGDSVPAYLGRIEEHIKKGLEAADGLSNEIVYLKEGQVIQEKEIYKHSVLLEQLAREQYLSERRVSTLEKLGLEQGKLNSKFFSGLQRSLSLVENVEKWKWLILGSLGSIIAATCGIIINNRIKEKKQLSA